MENRIAPVVLLSSLTLSLSSSANQPAQMPLSERVQRSDYIFVAEKIATYYVDSYGRVLTPKRAQKILDLFHKSE